MTRATDRDAWLRSIGEDLIVLVEWLPQAHRNAEHFAGLGYPRQSYPEASIAGGRYSDPVGTFATDPRAVERMFDRERDAADHDLQTAVDALHRVQAFMLRHTILAPRPPSGGLIDCANPHCDRFMTGIGNDRPRNGRCTRCYAHLRRYQEDWPTRRVVIEEGKTA